MTYIQSHCGLAAHPKTKRAARALGVSIPMLLGHLHLLWYWATEYAQDGDLSRYEDWEIAEAALWEGQPDAFIRALADCGQPGFLEMGDHTLLIHDWGEYFGRLVEKREANRERMRVRRAEHVQNTCDTRVGLEERSVEERSVAKKGGNARAREDTPPVDNLVAFATTELPQSESTEEDYKRTIERYRAKMTDEHIERIICDLGSKPKYHDPKKKLHLTLAAWLAKEPRDALRPEHQEFKPAAEQTPAERAAAKVAAKEAVERVIAMTGQRIGRPL